MTLRTRRKQGSPAHTSTVHAHTPTLLSRLQGNFLLFPARDACKAPSSLAWEADWSEAKGSCFGLGATDVRKGVCCSLVCKRAGSRILRNPDLELRPS